MEHAANTPGAGGELEGGALGSRGGETAAHTGFGGFLGFGGGNGGVEEVEMGEAVALREPKDEAVALKAATEVVGVADVLLLALFDEGAERYFAGRGRSGINTHLIDAIEVMAALVVFETDAAGVLAPLGAFESVLVGDKVGGGSDGAACGYLYYIRCLLGEFVARFGVFLLVENGLELVGRRRLYVIDVALLDRTDAIDRQEATVGTPLDVAAEVVAEGAFLRKCTGFGTIRLGHVDIVITDEGHEGGVGRGDRIAAAFVVSLHPMSFLPALGGIGDEAGVRTLVATGETPSTLSRTLRGFDGALGCGVGKGDGAVGIDLSEVPCALTAVGEVVLKAAIRQPAGVIYVIVNEAGLEGALECVSTIIILKSSLSIEGGREL
jgi:hypothetical protein